MPNHKYQFHVSLSTSAFTPYYTGHIRFFVATTPQGQNVKFPASYLRPFLTHQGIYGEFELETDENHKFINLRQLS